MAKTFAQLQKEVRALQAQAEAARKSELSVVIDKVQATIRKHGLTPEDLFGRAHGRGRAVSKKAAKKVALVKGAPREKAKLPPRYRDTNGNSWTGRGSQPRWLSAAIAAGQALESFRVEAPSDPSAAVAPGTARSKRSRATKADGKKQGASVAKFADGTGNSWSGKGPQPKWMKQALGDGKTIEELSVDEQSPG